MSRRPGPLFFVSWSRPRPTGPISPINSRQIPSPIPGDRGGPTAQLPPYLKLPSKVPQPLWFEKSIDSKVPPWDFLMGPTHHLAPTAPLQQIATRAHILYLCSSPTSGLSNATIGMTPRPLFQELHSSERNAHSSPLFRAHYFRSSGPLPILAYHISPK